MSLVRTYTHTYIQATPTVIYTYSYRYTYTRININIYTARQYVYIKLFHLHRWLLSLDSPSSSELMPFFWLCHLRCLFSPSTIFKIFIYWLCDDCWFYVIRLLEVFFLPFHAGQTSADFTEKWRKLDHPTSRDLSSIHIFHMSDMTRSRKKKMFISLAPSDRFLNLRVRHYFLLQQSLNLL